MTPNKKFCEDRNKLCPGKYGGHKPSSLGGRSIIVVRQLVSE